MITQICLKVLYLDFYILIKQTTSGIELLSDYQCILKLI